MTKWIRNRPPEDEEDYLVTDGESMMVGFYRKDAKAWDNCNFGWLVHEHTDSKEPVAENCCGIGEVIAWTELPKFPDDNEGWIPCSEHLPTKDGDYLVTEVMQETFSDRETGELMVSVESYYTKNSDDGYGAITPKGWQSSLRVIAWQPLVKPYTGGK